MREIMFDLASASRQLQQPGADLEKLGNQFYKVYANLMRRQSEV